MGYNWANYPDRTKNGDGIRGYHISQLNAVWISADEIKQAEMTDSSKQMFYNYTVGIPYENAGMKVYDKDVYSHSYDSFGPVFNRDNYKFLSVGIDWGKNHWLVVMGITHDGEKHILNFKSVEKPSTTDMMNMGADMEQIKLFISRYTPDIVVADVGDSGDKVSQLMNYFGKETVYGCSYKSTPRSTGQIEAKWSETNNIVTVDKLMQNKRYINMLKAGDILHYQKVDSDEYLPLYVEHWQNVIIREEDDQDTGEIYEIITRKGDDHFSQSSVYALLGLERLQNMYSNDPNSFNNSTAIDISFNQNGY